MPYKSLVKKLVGRKQKKVQDGKGGMGKAVKGVGALPKVRAIPNWKGPKLQTSLPPISPKGSAPYQKNPANNNIGPTYYKSFFGKNKKGLPTS